MRKRRYQTKVRRMAEEPRIPPGTGARIKARRQQLELTQAQVADRVGAMTDRKYRESWLAQIERGATAMRLDAAIAMADVLECSLDYMFGRSASVEIKTVGKSDLSRRLDDPLAPLEALAPDVSVQPIPLAAAPRNRRAKGSRPPRTSS